MRQLQRRGLSSVTVEWTLAGIAQSHPVSQLASHQLIGYPNPNPTRGCSKRRY
jgi:hypothetical protein